VRLRAEKTRELKDRIKANPLKYYWPHAYGCDGTCCSANEQTHTDYYGNAYTIHGCPQYEFHTTTTLSSALFGANRSGKTTGGVVQDAFDATGYYPEWFPDEMKWSKPTKGRIFAESFKVVQEVIEPEIERWFPKDSIKDKDKNNQGIYTKYYVKHDSGGLSTIDLMTYEQDASICEGWYGHYVHYDEPPPRAHRAATFRGLTDYMGHERFTLTPLKEPWIYDEVFLREDVFSTVCDIRHNLWRFNPLSGQNIGLPEENIKRHESGYTEEEVQARARGQFRFLAGRIWKSWTREVHTFDREEMWKAGEYHVTTTGLPPRHWKKAFLIDPHDRQPHALMWVTMDPEYSRLFVYREGWLVDTEFDGVIRYISEEEIEAREKIDYRIMDPNFGPKMQRNTGLTVRQTFEDEARKQNYPMRFDFGIDKKELGRKAVAELFHYNKNEPISIINRPSLMVAKDCVHCIYQIEHYVWADYKYGERDPKEQPKPMNTHFPDLLQYLGLFRWEATDAEVVEGVGSFYT
jgi:hypothetical protein